VKALARFGHSLGMAFQLIDDMLDFSARQAELGKAVGDDFRDGKMTLPIVLALKAADETERAFWRRTLEQQDQNEADLEHAIGLLHMHGTLDATRTRARFYADDAAAALALFPDQPIKQALLDVVEFCLQRGY
jgi:octaprenyl-diphosphate synthase